MRNIETTGFSKKCGLHEMTMQDSGQTTRRGILLNLGEQAAPLTEAGADVPESGAFYVFQGEI